MEEITPKKPPRQLKDNRSKATTQLGLCRANLNAYEELSAMYDCGSHLPTESYFESRSVITSNNNCDVKQGIVSTIMVDSNCMVSMIDSRGRLMGDGESSRIVHHSTPNHVESSGMERHRVFNATDHSKCSKCSSKHGGKLTQKSTSSLSIFGQPSTTLTTVPQSTGLDEST